MKVHLGAPGNDDPLGLKSQTLSMIKSDEISEPTGASNLKG